MKPQSIVVEASTQKEAVAFLNKAVSLGIPEDLLNLEKKRIK